MKKAAITGCTGAIGMALIDKCIFESTEVVAFVRGDSRRKDRIPDDRLVTVVECGLDGMKDFAVTDAIGGCDAFFHLAWEGTSGNARNDAYMQNRNVRYTLDAVNLASRLGCKAFIGAGSQAEYGRVDGVLTPDIPCYPENGYGIAKLCAGQLSRLECETKDMTHIWARILSVYGPYDNENSMIISVIRKLLNGDSPALTTGEQQWDYLYSGDAADMLYGLGDMACQEHTDSPESKVYCIGSGKAKPLKRYIEILRDAIDPNLSLGFGEIPYGSKQVMHLEADISNVVNDIGYNPKMGFEEGIRKTIDWCRNNN